MILKKYKLNFISVFFSFALIILSFSTPVFAEHKLQCHQLFVKDIVAVKTHEVVTWPELDTDQQKLNFLVFLETHIPNLFESLTEYGTDLFEALKYQGDVIRYLFNDPRFENILKTRPVRKKLDITISTAQTIKSVQKISDYQENEFKNKLVHFLQQSFGDKAEVFPQIDQTIQKVKSTYPSFDTSLLIFQTIKALPPELEKTTFSLTTAEKMNIFALHLTDDGVKKMSLKKDIKNFNFQTKQEVIETLNTLLERDEKLKNLIVLKVVAGHNELTHLDKNELINKIINTPMEQLVTINAAEFQSIYIDLNKHQELPKKDIFFRDLENSLMPFFNESQPKLKVLSQITLEEIPSSMGIMRGCLGNDCQTKNSGSFANSSFFQVWNIDPVEGQPSRGYVESATVESYGKRYLLINSINGLLSGDQIEAILQGMYQARHELGVEGLILISGNQIQLNFNASQIKERMYGHTHGKQTVGFLYFDADLRRALNQFTGSKSFNYHNPDVINSGVIYEPLTPISNLDVKVSTARNFDYEASGFNYGKFLLLSLDLEQFDKHLSAKIIRTANLKQSDIDEVRMLLSNPHKLKLAEYLKEVRQELLNRFQIQLDAKFENTQTGPFIRGILNSPDIMTVQKDKAIELVINLIKKNADLNIYQNVIIENLPVFEGDEKFARFMSRMYSREHGIRHYYPMWEITPGLAMAGLKIEKFSAAEAELMWQLGGDSYFRKGSARVMMLFNWHPEKTYPVLFGLARETRGNDRETIYTLKEAFHVHPQELKTAVLNAFNDSRDWVQMGALYAVEYTELGQDPEVIARVDDMAYHGLALTHEAHLHAVGVLHFIKSDGYKDRLFHDSQNPRPFSF